MKTQNAQDISIAKLEREGWRFSNWIAGLPGPNGEQCDETRIAVMVKRGVTRFGREYREVDPDGTIG